MCARVYVNRKIAWGKFLLSSAWWSAAQARVHVMLGLFYRGDLSADIDEYSGNAEKIKRHRTVKIRAILVTLLNIGQIFD